MDLPLCDMCGERPANVFLTQVQGNQVIKTKLCEECATRRAHEHGADPNLTLEEIVSGLVKGVGAALTAAAREEDHEQEDSESSAPRCPNCGLTYAAIVERGLFGCAQCYETFAESIPGLLKETQQGNAEHRGRAPAGVGERLRRIHRLKEMQRQLEEAVRREQYELAAKLRDEIRDVEKGATTPDHART